jgi:hypothetical protein
MIQDYINLITPSHRTKTKFIAWLTSSLTMINDVQSLLMLLYYQYDIDNAAGSQLDAIGIILGVSRTVNFQPASGSSLLSDANYRLVLKSKILANQWDGTRSNYDSLVGAVFDAEKVVIADNANMSIDVAMILDTTDTLVSELLVNGYLAPAPSGVLTNYKAALKGTWNWYYYQGYTWNGLSGYTWNQLAAGI